MEKLMQNAGEIFVRIASGFSHGLGQMASAGQSRSALPYQSKSAKEALCGDWEKVGSDLSNAIGAQHGKKA